MVGTVNRNIYFYVIYLKKGGSQFETSNIAFFAEFIKNTFNSNQIEINENSTEKLVMFKEGGSKRNGNDILRFRLTTIRKSDLPPGVNINNYTPMPLQLDPDQGLAEPCHLVVVNGRYVIAEFNTRAPRARFHLEELIRMFLETSHRTWKCQVRPIIDNNASRIVKNLNEIVSYEIKLASNHGKVFTKSKKSIFSTIRIPKKIENSSITIKLSARSSKNRKKDLQRVLNKLTETISDNETDLRKQKLTHFTVEGKTPEGISDKIDLINGLLKVKDEVIKLDSQRGVDSNSMFEKLETAYEDHLDYITSYDL